MQTEVNPISGSSPKFWKIRGNGWQRDLRFCAKSFHFGFCFGSASALHFRAVSHLEATGCGSQEDFLTAQNLKTSMNFTLIQAPGVSVKLFAELFDSCLSKIEIQHY